MLAPCTALKGVQMIKTRLRLCGRSAWLPGRAALPKPLHSYPFFESLHEVFPGVFLQHYRLNCLVQPRCDTLSCPIIRTGLFCKDFGLPKSSLMIRFDNQLSLQVLSLSHIWISHNVLRLITEDVDMICVIVHELILSFTLLKVPFHVKHTVSFKN